MAENVSRKVNAVAVKAGTAKPHSAATVCRRNLDGGQTSRREEDVLFRPTDRRTTVPEKIGKGGEKGGSGKGSPEGKT